MSLDALIGKLQRENRDVARKVNIVKKKISPVVTKQPLVVVTRRQLKARTKFAETRDKLRQEDRCRQMRQQILKNKQKKMIFDHNAKQIRKQVFQNGQKEMSIQEKRRQMGKRLVLKNEVKKEQHIRKQQLKANAIKEKKKSKKNGHNKQEKKKKLYVRKQQLKVKKIPKVNVYDKQEEENLAWNRKSDQGTSAQENSTLTDVVNQGYLLDMITNSQGSRLIQECMVTATIEEKQSVFEIIYPQIVQFCTDSCANYVIQKFFDYGLVEHIPYITRKLFGHVLPLCLNVYGSRIVQKAIDYSNTDTLAMLIREIYDNGGVATCIYNEYGNHVIQKCIEKGPPYVIHLIMESFEGGVGGVVSLAEDIYGSQIVQKLLKHCKYEQKTPIIMEIIKATKRLLNNRFGHNIIQDIVDKYLIHGNEEDREVMIVAILDENCNLPPLSNMIQHQYGNFIIQKMIKHASERQLDNIIRRMRMLGINTKRFRNRKISSSFSV